MTRFKSARPAGIVKADIQSAGHTWNTYEHQQSRALRIPLNRLSLHRADSIYIGDAYRGRGLGRVLLQALIERCETGPWRQMVAVIADGGSGGSLSLHTQLGFELTGTLKAVGFRHGRWLDTTLMQRRLGVGDSSVPDDLAQGRG